MMRSRTSAAGLAAAVTAAALMVSGCGSSSSATSASGVKAANVGYSTKFLKDPFQVAIYSRFSADAKAQGVSVNVADANSDPAKQVTDIRTMIDGGANGIVAVPVDGAAIVPAIDYAKQRKVPVVTVDDAPAGGGAYIVVRADNVGMGETACMEMGRLQHGKGKVLELQGALSSTNGRDRADGFESCMKKSFPGIQVISRPTDWDSQKAADAAQTMLTATPDLGGIFLHSDADMLDGVLGVMKNLHKNAKTGAAGHINLVTIDGSKGSLQGVRDGYVDAVVSQPADSYAKYALQYLRDAIAGKAVTPGPTDHNSKIIPFKGSLEDALAAPLVTKANVNDTSLWGNAA